MLNQELKKANVSPLRGEWIEIMEARIAEKQGVVSPLRGEWIEICQYWLSMAFTGPRLSEASGLKFLDDFARTCVLMSRLSEASGLKFVVLYGFPSLNCLASQRRVD